MVQLLQKKENENNLLNRLFWSMSKKNAILKIQKELGKYPNDIQVEIIQTIIVNLDLVTENGKN